MPTTPDPGRLHEVITSALDEIAATLIPVEGGVAWREDGQICDDLYAGTASVLFGCAEATATGMDTDRVVPAVRSRLLHVSRFADASGVDLGLFSGGAGISAALRAWSVVAEDDEALDAAQRITSSIAHRILASTEDPAACTDVISGDAGIALALLDDPSDAAADTVGLLADRLVRRAEPFGDGVQWRMDRSYERLMPGFSHGTAGVAYVLAHIARRLDRADLLEVTVRAADTLVRLATTDSGWALPLTMPPQPDRPAVYFGWCHGPSGTIRLFSALSALAPDPRWDDAAAACTRAVLDSGLPQRLYPGFWDNVARCCGTAGVGSMILDRYAVTGEPHLLDFCELLAADVLGRTASTAAGVAWHNTEHTMTPPELPSEPGLMQGGAGIVGWLARLQAVRSGAAPTSMMPTWI